MNDPMKTAGSPAPTGSALLPCPFCGGEADFHERKSGGHFVECSKCWASSRLIFAEKVDARRELSESWNARREEARLREVIEDCLDCSRMIAPNEKLSDLSANDKNV